MLCVNSTADTAVTTQSKVVISKCAASVEIKTTLCTRNKRANQETDALGADVSWPSRSAILMNLNVHSTLGDAADGGGK